MPTLIEIADAFENADVRKQIVGALIGLAKTIRNEAGSVPKHQLRLRWANKVVLSARQMAERMHGAVLTDSTVSAEIPSITDPAVQGAVESLVLKFANANLPEAADAT